MSLKPVRRLDRMTSRGPFQPKITLILSSEKICQIFRCLSQIIFLDMCVVYTAYRDFTVERCYSDSLASCEVLSGILSMLVFYFGDPDFHTNCSTENFWGGKALSHERYKMEGVKQGSLFSKQGRTFCKITCKLIVD